MNAVPEVPATALASRDALADWAAGQAMNGSPSRADRMRLVVAVMDAAAELSERERRGKAAPPVPASAVPSVLTPASRGNSAAISTGGLA